MREMGIPRHFPQEPIGVGEITGVATPVRALRCLDDTPAGGCDLLEQAVHLGFRADVVRQCEVGEACTIRRDAGIGRKEMSWVQGQPGLAELEEGDARG